MIETTSPPADRAAGSATGHPAGPDDPRIIAFCSEGPEVFRAVAEQSDVWKEDPFDVETIHDEARATFERLVNRATNPSGPSAGRILLLEGEAGSGKTHLMRAFRNGTHSRGRGYFGYMQMTSSTDHYGRYILHNLIHSLDQPYYEPDRETSGLMRLSTAIAESSKGVSVARLDQLRNEEMGYECLAKLVDALAEQVVLDDRLDNVDFDLVRALLYLQADDTRVKKRVLTYLRCEDLSERDRFVLGGIVPRTYDDAPQWLIQRLGELMAAIESVPLILCVDQLEGIYNLDDAAGRFRRAMATLCDLVSRIPTAVVVISCLEDYYKLLRGGLTRPLTDRIEKDPPPILLRGLREEGEVAQIIAQRLACLYDSHGVRVRDDDPTFPFPPAFLRALVGMRTRDILERCREYRARCIAAGRLVELDFGLPEVPPARVETTTLEQAWNDFRSSFTGNVPDDEEGLAILLARAIRACSEEVETGHWFEAEAEGSMVPVERHAPDDTVGRLLVGICNRSARGGGLGSQVAKVVERANDPASSPITSIIVRSTEFPTSPKAAVSQQIGELIARGGRRAVVEDSDWRAMMAFSWFRDRHQADSGFSAWLKEARPLGRLKALRTILDLDRLKAVRPTADEAPRSPEPLVTTEAVPPARRVVPRPVTPATVEAGPIAIGATDDRARGPVTLEPDELRRHAAFLGGTGSGKTTVALNVIEQLLLRGIPAILVDRKGDLCGYAREETWSRPLPDAALEARRRQLREQVEVAVFTPGDPRGRPLSISIAPAGMGQLGSVERERIARFSASALAEMMFYGTRGTDLHRRVILAKAIELLSQLTSDGTITLEGLIDYIAENDPSLVNAVGRLDTRLFDKLAQDLDALRLSRGALLSAQGEPMEAEALLGLGPHATPGKTRLSIISTKFLGATQDVQFWVSQLLVEMRRWAGRSPSERLQAALMSDEADLYLPATRQPPTKEPMEDLLKRARSAGLGLLLASQSPGDFDYKCRDNIRAWFVGRVKEKTAVDKMKPMLVECRVDVASKLPTQETGQFHLLRDGSVVGLRADRSAMSTEQVPEDEILVLARSTREAMAR